MQKEITHTSRRGMLFSLRHVELNLPKGATPVLMVTSDINGGGGDGTRYHVNGNVVSVEKVNIAKLTSKYR